MCSVLQRRVHLISPSLRKFYLYNYIPRCARCHHTQPSESTKMVTDTKQSQEVMASLTSMAHTSSLPRPNPWSVKAVLASLPDAPEQNTSSPIPFFHYIERLKTEKREGWRRFGISKGESIADHMYRMSLITMMAPPSLASKLDIHRCTRMALVHDMAEGLVGDLTPVDGVPKVEKSRREAETMDWVATDLLGKYNNGLNGKELRALWQEYEDGETAESKFVHDVDKLELLLQMLEYERAHDCQLDLSEFSWVAKRLALPEMKAWAQDILNDRDALWKKHEKEPRVEVDKAEVLRGQQDEYYGGQSGLTNGINGVNSVNGHA